MSRLFIKGLPYSLNDQGLQQYFQESGFEVTDAKVMHRSDGSSRGFGFVGLKDEGDAGKAREQLHQSFLHGSRLNVALAREMSMDAGHEPQTKRRKLNGNAAIAKKQEIIKPLPLPTQANTADAEEPEEKTLEVKMNDAGMSDAEYFASRLKRKLGDHLEPEAEEQQPTEDTADAKDEAESEEKEEHNDITKSILHTGRLFIRNLAYHATSDQIQSHFSPFGTCSLHLPADQERSSTGVAYVHFQDPQDAVKAHQALDGRPFLGRLIHVLPSVDRFAPAQPAKFVADPKKKSKSEQDHGQQSGATLVTNTDAVAASLASRLGLDKRDIIDATQSSSAVKLALAETSLLEETRRYCSAQGINLDALSAGGPKSKTVLLLKNLPSGTTSTTLQNLVAQYGQVKRLAVPPSATLAFIDFDDVTSAKNAQRALSYQKLGNSVIYVERMPASLWGDKPLNAPQSEAVDFQSNSDTAATASPSAESETPSDTLFVQNISFATTADLFERLFRSLPGFSYARLQSKKGFGFLGFKSVEHAQSAKTKMDGALLDGRPLKLHFSNKSAEQQEEEEALAGGKGEKGKKYSTKLVVKNVPFEASAKDLRQLFSAVATLKSLRLPKRADRRSRGFAFVEFASSKDSAAAAQMLKHTHLLGRHLVLEESSVDEKPGIDFL